MPQPLTITLSPELAEKIRAQAASHGYSSESDFVEDQLSEALHSDEATEEWLKTVGVARYDAYDANPENVMTGDELLSRVHQHLRQLRKAG
jgi:Arc/MetJ-type ribon-helix-helix transcriptional regulator